MAQAYDAVNSAIQGYYMNYAGLYIPEGKYKESASPGFQIMDGGFSYPVNLTNYLRWQLMQSRLKYFIFHEMYRRDTWTRAAVDYTVRRASRDPNILLDEDDPLNPDVRDLTQFLDGAWEDGDFEDLTSGVYQDLLEYLQSYIYVQREAGGDRRPIAFFPMDARITFPVTDQHGTILFHAQVYNGRATFFDKDEVLYFSRRNNGSDPKPISSMETLYESIVMELNANRYNAALFDNGLNIGAVFSIPNATSEDVDENLRYLEDHYSHPENAHRPLILKGEAKLLRDGMLLTKDLNWEALITVARQRVCAVFGVPESLLGVPGSTNRSEGQVHERQTYINTVRPLRKIFCRQFTKQFIKTIWQNTSVSLQEPINSLVPTKEELEAVALVAEIGATFNDIREMMGFSRVPNGDYFVQKNPANGGMVRLDEMMPGLGDPHFDFEAYKALHDEQGEIDQQNSQLGMAPAAGGTPYSAPRSQDVTSDETIAARIIDVSRSWDDEEGEWVSRRNPLAPGARGGNVYFTKSGKPRYGKPPTPKQAPLTAKDGSESNNTLINARDVASPKRLTPEEKAMVRTAHAAVTDLFRQAQEHNWTNEEFMTQLDAQGWTKPAQAEQSFVDVRAARTQARSLAESDTSKAYTILGADGAYFIVEQPLANFSIDMVSERKSEKHSGANTISKSVGVDEYISLLRSFIGDPHAPGL